MARRKDTEAQKSDRSSEHARPQAQGHWGESKREKFIRLAPKRVDNATKALRSIGRLANRYTYDYDEADTQKILRHLQSELDEIKKKFDRSQKTRQKFSFD